MSVIKWAASAVIAIQLISNAFGFSAWDNANKPERFEFNYERKLEGLPLEGKLTVRPWSGNYWATYEGGINYRWNQELKVEKKEERFAYDILNYDELDNLIVPMKYLSPAEKYDIFLSRKEFPLTNYERNRTKIMKTIDGSDSYDPEFKIPTWEGLCHAWAPATINYNNLGPIKVKNTDGIEIEFGSSDLKALLTYHLHLNRSPKTSFLGSRCNLDFKELKKELDAGTITAEEYDSKINSSKCADTNAGAFHIVITNQIGKMDQGFIVDVTRDSEVWNQAVYSYSYKELGTTEGASENAAPGTVKEVTIELKMTYIVEVKQRWDSEIVPASLKTKTYKYTLEINKDGQIIGGEWITEDRPDFIWKSLPAKFKGYFTKLKGLYEKSVASAEAELKRKELIKKRTADRKESDKIESNEINEREASEIQGATSLDAYWVRIKYATIHLDRNSNHLYNQLIFDLNLDLPAVKKLVLLTGELRTSLENGERNRNQLISLINKMVPEVNAYIKALNGSHLTQIQIDARNYVISSINTLINIINNKRTQPGFSSNPSAFNPLLSEEEERAASEEAARIEAERLAAIEAARIETERLAALESERLAAVEAARIEAERLAALEAARIEAERIAAVEAARVEAERLAAIEATRIEAERLAAIEAARVEAERLAAIEAARIEAERLAVEEVARLAAEEAERLAAIEAARIEAERVAAEEAARLAAIEAARIEAERLAAIEAARIEAERLAAVEAARIEAERLAAEETARIETERIAAVEAARIAALEAARLEAERVATDEAARLEAERIAAEEANRLEIERIALEESASFETNFNSVTQRNKIWKMAGLIKKDLKSIRAEIKRTRNIQFNYRASNLKNKFNYLAKTARNTRSSNKKIKKAYRKAMKSLNNFMDTASEHNLGEDYQKVIDHLIFLKGYFVRSALR